MNLLIDAGNTYIKWCIHDRDGWRAEGVLPHQRASELMQIVNNHPELQQVLCSNVAGETLAETICAALHGIAPPLFWLKASAQCCGVRNLYDNPTQLGADRWAALIGARALHSGPCLVVTAGTATTIDLLDANGNFQGGLIVPGIHMMRQALQSNTAQLPFSNGTFSKAPRNTEDAIMSGCLLSQVGAIEHMFRTIAIDPNARCLLSGGSAPSLSPYLEIPYKNVKNLVLNGLCVIARSRDAVYHRQTG